MSRKLPNAHQAHTAIIRTPLLPFSTLFATNGTYADRLAREHAALRALYFRPEICQALWLGSPSLASDVRNWLEEPQSPRSRRIERGLIRYAIRMGSRPTPFGALAGVSVVPVHVDAEPIVRSPLETCRVSANLDIHAAIEIRTLLLSSGDDLEQLSLVATPTRYPGGAGLVRYVECQHNKQSLVEARVSEFSSDEHIEMVLGAAGPGATVGSLAALLSAHDPSAPPSEVSAYLRELIDSGILVTELAFSAPGPEPAAALSHSIDNLTRPAERLGRLGRLLHDISGNTYTLGARTLKEVDESARSLTDLPASQRVLKADTYFELESGALSAETTEAVAEAADVLRRIGTAPPPSALIDFCARFRERFEEQSVPLLEALDPERGIGFDGLGQTAGDAEFDDVSSSAGAQTPPRLVSRVAQALNENVSELVLDDDDISALAASAPPITFQESFSVVGALAQVTEPAAAPMFRIDHVIGASAAAWLGRFMGLDGRIDAAVRRIARDEQACLDPIAIAEVQHELDRSSGNVTRRPFLRDTTLTISGSTASVGALPVSDLRVSVHGDGVQLWSDTLGRLVAPRITTAHNVRRSSNHIYRFLGMVQGQFTARFRWGALAAAPYLPRTRYKNAILAPARWRLLRGDLTGWTDKVGEPQWDAVHATLRRFRVPRFVVLADGDNKLGLDLESPLCVHALCDLAKNLPGIELAEMFPSPADLSVHGEGGHYISEFILPFVRTSRGSPRPRPQRPAPPVSRSERVFPPGSDWTYLKIYCGPVAGDRLITSTLSNLFTPGSALDSANWFFVRYWDPEPHVRVRVRGVVPDAAIAILSKTLNPWVSSGDITSLEFSTYDREIERYGGVTGTKLAEELSCIDSPTIAALLGDEQIADITDSRFWVAARLVLDSIAALGIPPKLAADTLDDYAEGLVAKRKLGATARRAFSIPYRTQAPTLDSMSELSDLIWDRSPSRPSVELMVKRRASLHEAFATLHRAEEEGVLTRPVIHMVPSYLHMTLNRVFVDNHFDNELRVVDALARLTRSRLAKQRRGRQTP